MSPCYEMPLCAKGDISHPAVLSPCAIGNLEHPKSVNLNFAGVPH